MPYPVACSPQAWAAGAVPMLIQACLGLDIDGFSGRVTLSRPHLPPGIDHLPPVHASGAPVVVNR